MQKLLLTTTALVAATMIAGGAEAAPKKTTSVADIESSRYLQQNDMMGSSVLKATVGGYANWYMGYADNKTNEGFNEFDILGDAQVHFNVEAALKNGLKVGAKMQLTTDTTVESAKIEDTYMYLSGKMGKVMVGRHDNVSEQLSVHAIDVGALGIQDSKLNSIIETAILSSSGLGDIYSDMTSLVSSYFTEDEYLTKVSYLSPNWKGLQFGVTYAPFGENTETNFVTEAYDKEVGMISAVYESKIDQVGFAVSAGYGFVNTIGVYPDVTQFNLGARVEINNFTISGAYKKLDIDDNSTEISVYDFGVSYETGPYAMSVSYISGKYETNFSNIGLFFDLDYENSTLLVSGKYNMSAGVDAFATLGFGDRRVDILVPIPGASRSTDGDGWAIVGGMMLSF